MTNTGAAAARGPRRAWKPYLLLGAAVFLLHAAVTGGHLLSPDGELLFRQAQSIALRGALDVAPLEYSEELRMLLVDPGDAFAVVQGPGGRFHPQYLPLQPLLSVPLIWMAEATRPLFGEWFAGTLPDTDRHPEAPAFRAWRRGVVVACFNPLVNAATALLLLRLGTMLTGSRRAGMYAAVFWAFGTMAWPHSRTFFTEPLAGLFALAAFERLLRWNAQPLGAEGARRRLSLAIQFGAALGAAIWTRMDSPLIAFGFGIGMVAVGEVRRAKLSAWGAPQVPGLARDYAVAGAVVLASFAALVVYNDARFSGLKAISTFDFRALLSGGYAAEGEGVKFTTPFIVGAHGFLASPGKGMFFFSPALVLGLWGWAKAASHARWTGWFLLGGFAPFALGMVLWQNWDGGWCWGPRHIHQLHAPIMLGAAFLFTGPKAFAPIRNGVAKAVLAAGVAVQLYGSSQSPMDFYHELYMTPRDGEYYRVAYRAFEYASVGQSFAVDLRREDGTRGMEVRPSLLPAPLVDSLYLPHHTQWTGNARLWRLGYRDWLLWRIATGQGFRDSISTLAERPGAEGG